MEDRFHRNADIALREYPKVVSVEYTSSTAHNVPVVLHDCYHLHHRVRVAVSEEWYKKGYVVHLMVEK